MSEKICSPLQVPSIATGMWLTKSSPSRHVARPFEAEGEEAERLVGLMPPRMAERVFRAFEDFLLVLEHPRVAVVEAHFVVAEAVGAVDRQPAHGLHGAERFALREPEQPFGEIPVPCGVR